MPPNRNPTLRQLVGPAALVTFALVALWVVIMGAAPIIQTGGYYGDGERAAQICDSISASVAPFDTFDLGTFTLGASARDTLGRWGHTRWFELGTDQDITIHLYFPSGQEDTMRLVANATDNKRWACDSIEVIAGAAGASGDYRLAGYR